MEDGINFSFGTKTFPNAESEMQLKQHFNWLQRKGESERHMIRSQREERVFLKANRSETLLEIQMEVKEEWRGRDPWEIRFHSS